MAPASKSQRGTADEATRVRPPTVLNPAGRTRRDEHHDDQTVEGMLFVPVRPASRGAA